MTTTYAWYWTLEGIAWYALPSQQAGTVPLYWFYNTNNGTHFFTATQAEKDAVVTYLSTWTYEGISQYVWP